MNLMINRPNNMRRHVYELRGGEASGKTSFMEAMAELAGEDKVARMTGEQLHSGFAYQHLEGMRVLILEETRPDQVEELVALVTQRNIVISKMHEESFAVPNTIEFIFYVMATKKQPRQYAPDEKRRKL